MKKRLLAVAASVLVVVALSGCSRNAQPLFDQAEREMKVKDAGSVQVLSDVPVALNIPANREVLVRGGRAFRLLEQAVRSWGHNCVYAYHRLAVPSGQEPNPVDFVKCFRGTLFIEVTDLGGDPYSIIAGAPGASLEFVDDLYGTGKDEGFY